MRNRTLDLAQELARLCPRLGERYTVTSPRTSRYNCLAFVAGEERIEWVPGGDPDASFWPLATAHSLAQAEVIAAYETLGFGATSDSIAKESVARIALYVDADGDIVHAARQEESGRWRSKIGTLEDIEHDDPAALEGGEYGAVAVILCRSRS